MGRSRAWMRIGWAAGVIVIVMAIAGSGLVWAQGEPALDPDDLLDAGESLALPGSESDPWTRGVPLAQRQAARVLFLQGNVLMRDAFFDEAAAHYRGAIERWDHPAFHFNLAMAQRLLDQPVAAHDSLGKALQYGEVALGRDKHAHALRVRALLEQQLARLEITCDQPGAAVAMDGEHLFSGPGRYEGLVRPGVHQLAASKEGHVPEGKLVRLEPGKSSQVTLALMPIADMLESRRWARWKPWAVVGAGAATLLAGNVLQWRASAGFLRFDEAFDGYCSMGADPGEGIPGCKDRALPSGIAGQLDRATLQRNMAMASYVAGGALFVTGLALVISISRACSSSRGPCP